MTPGSFERRLSLIAENLANLTAVAGRRLTIEAFPWKIKGGDGAPARIFALQH